MSQVNVLGIDVAKDSLVIFDTATKKHFTVDNNSTTLTKACLTNSWLPNTHIAGLESTGDYSLEAMKTLVDLGFKVRLLNPILTQAGIKRTVRGTKTDATDSELIAELTAKGEGYEINEKYFMKSYFYSNDDSLFWSEIEVLSEPIKGKNTTITQSRFPDIAVENDKIYVVWQDSNDLFGSGTDWDIFYKYYDGSTWSKTQAISEPEFGWCDINIFIFRIISEMC